MNMHNITDPSLISDLENIFEIYDSLDLFDEDFDVDMLNEKIEEPEIH